MGFAKRFFISIILALAATAAYIYLFNSGGFDSSQINSYGIIALIALVVFFIIGSLFSRKKNPQLASLAEIQRGFNYEATEARRAFESGKISAQQYRELMASIENKYNRLKKAA